MEPVELTREEKEVLKIMLNNMRNLLDDCDLVLCNGDYFSANDFYTLVEKLGIEEYL